MYNYKNYSKEFIGASDIASITIVGNDGHKTIVDTLDFGEDGVYNAYIVPKNENDCEESGYKKVGEYKHFAHFYDDDDLVYMCEGKTIEVFRNGDYGCVIAIEPKTETI